MVGIMLCLFKLDMKATNRQWYKKQCNYTILSLTPTLNTAQIQCDPTMLDISDKKHTSVHVYQFNNAYI